MACSALIPSMYLIPVIFFKASLTLHRLNVEVVYVPDITPNPFSSLCEAAYRRNASTPGPDEDPAGWLALSHANIHGKLLFNHQHLVNDRQAYLRCTVSLLILRPYAMLDCNINYPCSCLLPNQCVFFSLSKYSTVNWSIRFSNVTLEEAWFPAILASTAQILKRLTCSQTMNASGFASSVGYIYMKIQSRPIHEHSRPRMPVVTRFHRGLLRKLRPLRELFGGQPVRKNQIHVTCRARFIWIRSCSPHPSFYSSRFQWAFSPHCPLCGCSDSECFKIQYTIELYPFEFRVFKCTNSGFNTDSVMKKHKAFLTHPVIIASRHRQGPAPVPATVLRPHPRKKMEFPPPEFSFRLIWNTYFIL